MSLSSLQILADNRDALLLAEIAALLHDIGKLSSAFIDQMSQKPSEKSRHFEHESAIERINGFVDIQFLDALRSKSLSNLLHFNTLKKGEQIRSVLELIIHHDRSKHSAYLVRLLNRCDVADSGADKGTTRQAGLPIEAKQSFDSTYIATAFGYETKLDESGLDNERLRLSECVGQHLNRVENSKAIADIRAEILRVVQNSYVKGLGETRRSANDVTLWQHSFSVATLYKSAVANLLIAGQPLAINDLRWRLLRVNFDVLGLYAKAIKIADLLGYQRAVDEACKQIKRLIEEEYPLGNEVYRDTTGIYFTFPNLDLPSELAQEIRRRVEEKEPELAPRIAVTVGDGQTATEELKGILAKAHSEALATLAYPFDAHNLSTSWQQQWDSFGKGTREVCPVCRLRPKNTSDEVCRHCQGRRESRVKDWLANPQHTIWIDEIADQHDRVALIVGKFGLEGWLSGDLVRTMLVRADLQKKQFVPKNPSPARLRRVWETCQRFWSETVYKILNDHRYGQGTEYAQLRCERWIVAPKKNSCVVVPKKSEWKKQEYMPYDGTVNGRPISLLWRKEKFVTVINMQLTGKLQEGQKITVSDPHDPIIKISFTVDKAEPAEGDLGHYKPFLTLLTSPDRFLVFVPAADALEIADKITQEYAKQFGKVQNRLPLFLGIVFFPRKSPLLAVMDAARRMLETPLSEKCWTVECCQPESNGLEQYIRLCLPQANQRTTWRVPVKMGDSTTKDIWYPYCFVERFVDGAPDHRQYCFQLDHRWLVHVEDLKEGDTVAFMPSRFAYLWLEHTAERFAFDPGKDALLLDELSHLMRLWQALKMSGITDTGLRAVQALFESKEKIWGRESEEFARIVRTTLQHEGLSQVLSVEDVISGRLARCLELHMKILKLRVKEVPHEQRSAAAV